MELRRYNALKKVRALRRYEVRMMRYESSTEKEVPKFKSRKVTITKYECTNMSLVFVPRNSYLSTEVQVPFGIDLQEIIIHQVVDEVDRFAG
jgi:hypothetical protein